MRFPAPPALGLLLLLTASASSQPAADPNALRAHAVAELAALRARHASPAPAPPPPPPPAPPAPGGCEAYGSIHAYVLTATWDAGRVRAAAALCSALRSSGHACTQVPALHAATPAGAAELARLEAAGWLARSPAPPPPRWLLLLAGAFPRALRPLLPERPANMLHDGSNGRAAAAAANTAGWLAVVAAARAEAEAAANATAHATQPAPPPPLVLYLEDDAELGASAPDVGRLLLSSACAAEARLPGWHLLSLAPPPAVCARSRSLPWRDRSPHALVRPRLAFSRTTAVALGGCGRGAAAVLAALPADNVVDLWLRRLMRQGRLRLLLSCAGLFRNGAESHRQVQ